MASIKVFGLPSTFSVRIRSLNVKSHWGCQIEIPNLLLKSSLFFHFKKIETVGHNPLMVMGCLAALLGTAHLTAAAAIPPAGAATAIRETNLRLDLKKRN